MTELSRTEIPASGAVGMPRPLTEAAAERIARRFAALADPLRIRILDTLRERGECSVGELVELLGARQQNVSKHLGILLQQGIVARRKERTRALYRIADDTVLQLCELVCGSIERELAELARLVGTDNRAAQQR